MKNIHITEKSYFLFSGGEVHTNMAENELRGAKVHGCRLILRHFRPVAIESLYQHTEILRRYGVENIELVLPYLPYARQDRVMDATSPFSLLLFCRQINAQGYSKVTVYDPHSDVGPALLNNCQVIPQWDIVKKAAGLLVKDPEVVIVSPDAGAYKKVAKLIQDDLRIALGTKVRDATGSVTRTEVWSPESLAGRTCLIVDDICDGGRTFTNLATALKDEGAAKVILYVTHGIFSRGYDVLTENGVDEVITTDTFNHSGSPAWVHTYPVIQYAYGESQS